MTGAEAGLLMLTCRLGDFSVTPLSARQYYALRQRLSDMECNCNKELTESDLRALGIPMALASKIISLLSREDQLSRYLSNAWQHDICAITRLDANYPGILEHRLGDRAPVTLFCKGDYRLLSTECVSLVGSRKLREPNRNFAQRIGELAALEGYTLVSGGASGADSAAQDACLSNGGNVIVFTPERLDRIKLRDNVLYCSEDGWELDFTSQRALSRNRLIHALGQKTFVAQCNYGYGGSWRGAVESLKAYECRQFVFWDGSRGAEELLRLGAVDVTNLDSIRQLKTGQESFFE